MSTYRGAVAGAGSRRVGDEEGDLVAAAGSVCSLERPAHRSGELQIASAEVGPPGLLRLSDRPSGSCLDRPEGRSRPPEAPTCDGAMIAAKTKKSVRKPLPFAAVCVSFWLLCR